MQLQRVWLRARNIVKRDKVLAVAMLLAASTSLVTTPRLESINWQVLGLLLSLMLVVAGFKRLKVLDYLAVRLVQRCHSLRGLYLALIALTFVSSMLITNDVALLTFVPLTLTIGRALRLEVARLVIWQTLAANLGSSMTPMGNPQNLFLYEHFQLAPGEFMVLFLPLGVLSVLFLVGLCWSIRPTALELELPEQELSWSADLVLFSLLFGLNLLAVLRVLPVLTALLLTLAVVVWRSPRLLRLVDYNLLLTFIGFFVFIGNLASWPVLLELQEKLLGTELQVYLSSIVLSQFLSNVPAAMLLAGFTTQSQALLLGVNVGGLGTLVASMASVIAYKLYQAESCQTNNNYLHQFLYYNFMGLVLLGITVWWWR